MKFQRQLEDYARYLETLNARSVRLVEKLAAPGMRYSSPLHDVAGVDAVERVFSRRMAQFPTLRCRIGAMGTAFDGQTGFIAWRWMIGPQDIDGVAELMFADDGTVMRHHDHWDASRMMEETRLTGWLIRKARARLA